MTTITLYRPVGPTELDLIKKSDYTKFPPRLPEQPIFYPVMNKEYAIQITDQWNLPAYGLGAVVEFNMDIEYINKFNVENVGDEIHNELWIPAEQLNEFNDNIIGIIKITYINKNVTKKMFYGKN